MQVSRTVAALDYERSITGKRPTQRIALWSMVGIPLAFLALLFYLPLLQLLIDSLGTSQGFSTLLTTLGDGYFWHLFTFTAKQAALSTLASLIIGVPLGYLLATYRLPLPRLWRALTIVPFVLPTIVVALGFILFFGHNGYLNRALFRLTGIRLPILYSLQGIILAHAFYNAPIVARTTAVAWERLDPALEQGARSLGASAWYTFRKITWPLLFPATASSALLAFVFSFFSFPLVLALGGARYATLEVEVFTQVRVLLDYGTGTAYALFETIASLALTYFYLKLEARSRLHLRSGRSRKRKQLWGWHRGNVLLWAYLGLMVVLYAGPLGSVLYHSLVGEDGSFSLAAYNFVLSPKQSARLGDSPLGAIVNSLTFGAGALAISLVLGTALSAGLVRIGKRAARLCETLAMTPLAISSVAFGYAMMRAYRLGVLRYMGLSSTMAIMIAHAILGLPFVIRVLRPHFQLLDRSLLQAAQSLGATAKQAFWYVELPLSASALLVAAGFAFSMSVAEMSATIMLAQPTLSTMPLSVYHLVSAREFSAASAMAVLLMLFMAGTFLIIEITGQGLLGDGNGRRHGVSEI